MTTTQRSATWRSLPARVGLLLVCLLGANHASAAEGAATQSMWDVIRTGLEWPGYIIIAGSMAAVTLVFEHFYSVRRGTIVPAAQLRRTRELFDLRQYRTALDELRGRHAFFARVVAAGLEQGRHGYDAMRAATIDASSEMSGRMFRKVEYLNILGNLGPLLGLLGTVLGMIVSFGELGAGGGAASGGAGDLARGISLALVNTLLGLGLAIVGLGFFGVCRNRVDALTTEATVAALNLLEAFRPAPRRQAAATGAASAARDPDAASSSRA